jgi:hypothetical protein
MTENENLSGPRGEGIAEEEVEKRRNHIMKKLNGAIALKDYAISQSFDVSEDIIKKLNKASKPKIDILQAETDIDTAIRDLTSLTYPTTIYTVQSDGKSYKDDRSFRIFIWALVTAVILSLAWAVISYWQLNLSSLDPKNTDAGFWESCLALSLGLMGSSTYIIFNVIGILSEKAFDSEETYSNYVRLILGPVVGWLFYFTLADHAFIEMVKAATTETNKSTNPAFLLLPFLAGFSTRLVVGVINQAIRAIELTLGLEDKASRLAKRKAKKNR